MKEMQKKIEEFRQKDKAAKGCGGEKQIVKQHKMDKLTARERLDLLFDSGSFSEIDLLVKHRCYEFGMKDKNIPAEGVVTGFGSVEGRTVMAFAEDYTALAGTFGESHGNKIVKSIELATQMRTPIVGINDSGGARLQEGLDASHAYARLFSTQIKASGLIPQIALLMGPCMGGQAYHPIMMDFLIMVKNTSHLAIAGPAIVETMTGEEVALEDLGGAEVHAKVTGQTDLVTADDSGCISITRKLLSYLPCHTDEKPPLHKNYKSPSTSSDYLESIVPGNLSRPYDMKKAIAGIVDVDSFLEFKPEFARNIIIGFATIGGHVVGLVANQPNVHAGGIDVNASDKAARFIRFCDLYNIPLIQFMDTPAYWIGTKEEHAGILRHGAKMLFAFVEATVPKITIIFRKAYAGAYVGMCCKDTGADLVYAWPTAVIALVAAETAVSVLYAKEIASSPEPEKALNQRLTEYDLNYSNPYLAAQRGYIDGIIEPKDTRVQILQALRLTKGKKEVRPKKKYANITL